MSVKEHIITITVATEKNIEPLFTKEGPVRTRFHWLKHLLFGKNNCEVVSITYGRSNCQPD